MPAQGYIRLDYLFHRQNKTITMKLIVKLFILDSFIQTNRVSDPPDCLSFNLSLH